MARVFICNDGGNAFVWTGAIVHSGGTEPVFAYPQCQPGFAQWVDVAELIGDAGATTGGTTGGTTAPVDPSEAATAFGAGFGIFGIGLLLAMAVRIVVRFVSSL